jgi:hypothetical protein
MVMNAAAFDKGFSGLPLDRPGRKGESLGFQEADIDRSGEEGGGLEGDRTVREGVRGVDRPGVDVER